MHCSSVGSFVNTNFAPQQNFSVKENHKHKDLFAVILGKIEKNRFVLPFDFLKYGWNILVEAFNFCFYFSLTKSRAMQYFCFPRRADLPSHINYVTGLVKFQTLSYIRRFHCHPSRYRLDIKPNIMHYQWQWSLFFKIAALLRLSLFIGYYIRKCLFSLRASFNGPQCSTIAHKLPNCIVKW